MISQGLLANVLISYLCLFDLDSKPVLILSHKMPNVAEGHELGNTNSHPEIAELLGSNINSRPLFRERID